MDYVKKRDLILNGKLSKVILTLALPIMFNNLIQTMYNLADTFWVSKLGHIQVAASTFVWPVLFLMISLGIGINVAGTSMISQYTGANNKEKAKEVATQIFIFSIIFSSVLSIIGYFASPLIVKVMGATGELFYNSNVYLKIMFFDFPGLFIFSIFTAIRQAQGDTLTPMILNVAACLLNVLLDPVFIFPLKLGIGGAAIATVLSKVVFIPYILYLLFTKKDGVHLSIKDLKFKKEILKKIIKIGLPSSIGQSGEALGFIILNMLIASYGSYTLAAFGIGNRINSIVMMPALGIGNALVSIIGQNIGADNLDRAKEAFKTSMFLSISILLIGGTILFLISKYVIGIFTTDINVLRDGTLYLKLISATLPFMGIFQICVGTFQGSGHTIYSMIMEMSRLWLIRLPLVTIFKLYTSLGSSGVWIAMIISNGIICIVGLLIYKSGKWQNKIIKKEYSKLTA